VKFLVGFLLTAFIAVWQYNLPSEGDIRHWSGEPWVYKCNWVGCGWSPIKGQDV
jgi:hypothetical protein